MKVFIGSDHNGFQLKKQLLVSLAKKGYDVIDVGDKTMDPDDDFPIFASRLTHQLLASDEDAKGILLCSSGQGMCMAANRHKGIRGAIGYDEESIESSRNDDDSNVLCLPAATLNEQKALSLIELWLLTPFADAPRFRRRIKELDEL